MEGKEPGLLHKVPLSQHSFVEEFEEETVGTFAEAAEVRATTAGKPG